MVKFGGQWKLIIKILHFYLISILVALQKLLFWLIVPKVFT